MGEALDKLTRVQGYTRADGVRVKSYVRGGTFAGKPSAKKFAIAEAEGKIIGALGWFTDPEKKGEIFHVEVDESHRRQGIATRLHQLAKAEEPSLRHSDALSEDAVAWINGMKRKRT